MRQFFKLFQKPDQKLGQKSGQKSDQNLSTPISHGLANGLAVLLLLQLLPLESHAELSLEQKRLIAIELSQPENTTQRVASYMSLQGAIHTALKSNSKTKSKDMQIEALRASTQAARDRLFPQFSLYCGITKMNGSTELMSNNYPARSTSQFCSAGVSYVIFDGGAARSNLRASEFETLATEQRFKSTNILLQNTYGSLAKQTLSAYVALSGSKSSIEFFSKIMGYLQKVRSIAQGQEDIGRVENFINQIQGAVRLTTSTFENQKEDFQYVVTVAPPENIDNLEEINASLLIPATGDLAYDIALQKSPDLKATDLELAASKERVKSARAQTLPRVEVSLNRSNNKSQDQLNSDNNSRGYSNSVSLNVNIPLDAANFSNLKASQKSASANQFERDSALEDLKHNLRSTYSTLATQLDQIAFYKKSYSDNLARVDELIRQIDQKQSVNAKYATDQLSSLFSNYEQYVQAETLAINLRFNIQQVSGTLFDIVEQTKKIK